MDSWENPSPLTGSHENHYIGETSLMGTALRNSPSHQLWVRKTGSEGSVYKNSWPKANFLEGERHGRSDILRVESWTLEQGDFGWNYRIEHQGWAYVFMSPTNVHHRISQGWHRPSCTQNSPSREIRYFLSLPHQSYVRAQGWCSHGNRDGVKTKLNQDELSLSKVSGADEH